MATTAKRKSAEERRESVLDAAYVEFAEHGLDGASTEDIAAGQASRSRTSSGCSARRSSCSSPSSRAASARRSRSFQRAAEGKRGEEALRRDGRGLRRALLERPHPAARADAGLRGLRRPGDPRPSSGTATATSSPTSSASPALPTEDVSAVLRDRDAAERDRVDGPRRPAGAVGAAAARGLREDD